MLRIIKAGLAEQTISKSRFIAYADYCEDEQTVGVFLRKIANAHAGASHLAYAYRLKTAHGIVQRFSDAGEPSGTAGKPVLQLIEGRDLINVGIGIIRYYGGINLGTGGLVRAYGSTAKMALEAAVISPYVEMRQIRLAIDYKSIDSFIREVGKLEGKVLDKSFGERVTVTASLPGHSVEALMQKYGH